MLRAIVLIAGLFALTGCGRPGSATQSPDLAAAAESYVRLVLALGDRDSDSLDSYHGPPAWMADARARHATLADVQRDARALADSLASTTFQKKDDEVRQAFLIRQLRAVVVRIDILGGARPAFAEEARRLFGLETTTSASAIDAPTIRAAVDRELPGKGSTTERLFAFERRFLIPGDRLPAVMARAIEGCRAATATHIPLPPGERVDVTYVRDSPWSAYTRYEGHAHSTIQVNAALPLTVDRAVDLACHEAYPGHHTIGMLIESRLPGQVELLVQPAFSPQTLLHESASSSAGTLAFSEAERVTFERDVLFPLAALDTTEAEHHVRVSRLVDQLHGVEAEIARRYLDGELDFPRASIALEREALMPSADLTLKFLNRFRTYAATYTIGRDRFWQALRVTNEDDLDGRWRAYVDLVSNPAQALPSDR